ncbi:hypothetical protein AMTR_s00017p00128590 [Amborella trichopoda]|uniref:Uncharacterized protein n=1 Tax=Amborella trichopoda TaxID=13333 RepID=W1PKK2_AMBTC|nr:hypothetical protein AMTR_s00017p00128590 [Amborella trichopoda]
MAEVLQRDAAFPSVAFGKGVKIFKPHEDEITICSDSDSIWHTVQENWVKVESKRYKNNAQLPQRNNHGVQKHLRPAMVKSRNAVTGEKRVTC